MKAFLISSIFLVIATSFPLHATSVSLSSSRQGRDVVDTSGLALGDGDLVLIGTFSNPGAITDSDFSDLQSTAGWTQFGTSLQIGSIFGTPGKLLGTDSDLGASATDFDGKTIYLWVFNASTASAATQQGIFTADAGTPAWVFPANNGGIGDLVTLDANDSSLTAAGDVGAVSASHLTLAPVTAVPEPASYGFLGLAAMALAAHRLHRRRAAR